MREAVGGSLLLYLIIPIIIIFIIFIGFIMNYASAYRAANYYVSQIENCQGHLNNCGSIDIGVIENTLKEKYRYIRPKDRDITPCYFQNGSGFVVRVTLPVEFELPIMGKVPLMNVKAETKSIIVDESVLASAFRKTCHQ